MHQLHLRFRLNPPYPPPPPQYVVSDRGPHGGLWPLWVPQLQAHMAAAGTGSALLLSRSASRGVRLFRVYRCEGCTCDPGDCGPGVWM